MVVRELLADTVGPEPAEERVVVTRVDRHQRMFLVDILVPGGVQFFESTLSRSCV